MFHVDSKEALKRSDINKLDILTVLCALVSSEIDLDFCQCSERRNLWVEIGQVIWGSILICSLMFITFR